MNYLYCVSDLKSEKLDMILKPALKGWMDLNQVLKHRKQRTGTIILVPKQGKDTRVLGKLRSITLLKIIDRLQTQAVSQQDEKKKLVLNAGCKKIHGFKKKSALYLP